MVKLTDELYVSVRLLSRDHEVNVSRDVLDVDHLHLLDDGLLLLFYHDGVLLIQIKMMKISYPQNAHVIRFKELFLSSRPDKVFYFCFDFFIQIFFLT